MVEPRIKIAIIGAPRTGVDTINPTIRSMRAEDDWAKVVPMGVFWDGIEKPALEKPPSHLEIRSPQELETLRSTRYFGANNFARAARWASSSPFVVVSDDDVIMCASWLKRAVALLLVAEAEGHRNAIVAFQHFYQEIEDVYKFTGMEYSDIELWSPRPNARSNGMFPVLMRSETALPLAGELETMFPTRESDFAVLYHCLINKRAQLFFTDPCMAMHMNIGSNFGTGGRHNTATKRFRPY